MNEYYIPTGTGESEYVEKRSQFLGHVRRVETEDEARAFIAEMKKKHYDARHNCWCYIIRGGAERYSDDGEPQGTAGIPMLEVFRREEITNVVCVVTRYFGGVLLQSLEVHLPFPFERASGSGPLAASLLLVIASAMCHWRRASR